MRTLERHFKFLLNICVSCSPWHLTVKCIFSFLLLHYYRSLPLSAMAEKALDELSPFITDARPLTTDIISSKIKLLAQRKSYLSGEPFAPSDKSTASKLDCFENAEECYMWRWELSSIDLLPQKEATKIKKARTMRSLFFEK